MYKRGTDLKHCPDSCGSFRGERSGRWGIRKPSDGIFIQKERYDYYCSADDTDTCPREQADFLVATYRKERTND